MSTKPTALSPHSPSARHWLPLVALALITLIALGLRLWQIDESLWLDELHTSWVVIDGPGPIAHRATMGNTSPVYFYAVWAVTQVLGHTEFSLRLLSLVAGVGLVPLLYWVVVKATGQPAAGLLAAAMAALDPNGLYYSIEARSYALVTLVSVVQVWLFWRLLAGTKNAPQDEASGKPRLALRMGFIATSLLLFYLHYTTQLLLAAEVIAYALLCARAERLFGWLRLGTVTNECSGGPFAQVSYRPLSFLLDLSIILMGEVAMLPSLLAIYHRRGNWEAFVRPQGWAGVFRLFPLVIYLITPLVALAAGWVIWRVWPGRKSDSKQTVSPATFPAGLLLLCLCWFFVPVLAAWMATEFDLAAVFLRRYLMASAAALFVLAGLIYAATPSRLARAGCWIAVLVFLLGGDGVITTGVARQYLRDGRFVVHSDEDWRGAVAWLNEQMEEREGTVVVYASLIEQLDIDPVRATPEEIEYFNYPVRGIYWLEGPLATPAEPESQVAFGLVRGDATVLVRRYLSACQAPRAFLDLPELWPPPASHVRSFAGVMIIGAETLESSSPSEGQD